jgi:tol-pal system protein YbgF
LAEATLYARDLRPGLARAEPMGAEGLTLSVFSRRAGASAPALTIAGAAILMVLGASGLRAGDAAMAAPMRLAQSNGQPPGDVPGGQVDSGMDEAALVVRVDKLENQLRAANGAIEELQNQNRRLAEQLKRFQEDVEFRLNGAHGAAPIAETPAPAKPGKRSDAFDPAVDPNAAGAPRPLGATTPSVPLAQTPGPTPLNPPLELSRINPNAAAPSGPLAEEPKEPTVLTGPGGSPDEPREQFNAAYETYRAGQYEKAEQQFRAFLAKNAASKMAPDVVFFIGESFFKRSRPREAAEQYLKLSTDYAKSSRAPESMLRLGQSLAALGNNAQACATLGEVGKRYPRATATVGKSVEEMQKDHC